MKPLLLPVALLAFFTTGCYSMSKYQCPPDQRRITVRNWTFGEIGVEGDGIAKATLNYDDSITIIQYAENSKVSPITVTVTWGDKRQNFSYSGEITSQYYYGNNILLELTEGDDPEKLEHCCP